MALFNAQDLLGTEETEHEFQIDGFKDANGEPVSASLTIAVNAKVREVAQKARDKHNNVKFLQKKGKTEIQPVNEPLQYCEKVTATAYLRSDGDILDVHNREVFVALLRKIPAFATELARLLFDFFESGGLFSKVDEEDDRKN